MDSLEWPCLHFKGIPCFIFRELQIGDLQINSCFCSHRWCQNCGCEHISEKCVFLRSREEFFPSTFSPLLPFLPLTIQFERLIWSLHFGVVYFWSAVWRTALRGSGSWPKSKWRTIHCPYMFTICMWWEWTNRANSYIIHTADQQARWNKLHVSKPMS